MENMYAVLDVIFSPICVMDKNFNVKFFNASWLQHISKPIDLLTMELNKSDQENIKEQINVLDNKIRHYIEGQVCFKSIDKTLNYKICNYNSDYLLTLEDSFLKNNVSLYDHLTGLPTRQILMDNIHNYISICKRKETKLLVFFIDLDNFKPINDVYGHSTGDFVLKETVSRIKKTIREHDIVARYGGDEFIIAAPFFNEAIHGAMTAKRILRKIQEKIMYKDTCLQIGASIGIGIYPDDLKTESPNELIKVADQAMYIAKENGKNSYCFFSEKYR
ncbi:MAG: GGDEF domain-containing protein [Candidatus Woesearchaeota archaeon]